MINLWITVTIKRHTNMKYTVKRKRTDLHRTVIEILIRLLELGESNLVLLLTNHP